MKFKIELVEDSEQGYFSEPQALEVETIPSDWVELTFNNPHRTVKLKKSELRYALAFCGSVEDH